MDIPSDPTLLGSSARTKYVVLLKVSQVATALSISRSSVYRLFETGDLKWVKVGSHRRVSSAEIDRFIAAHTDMAAS